MPDIDPDFALTVGTAGTRPGRRLSLWTYSQQGLIDAMQAARSAAITSPWPSAPPFVPAGQRLPRVMMVVLLLVTAAITAFMIDFDQSSWFQKIADAL